MKRILALGLALILLLAVGCGQGAASSTPSSSASASSAPAASPVPTPATAPAAFNYADGLKLTTVEEKLQWFTAGTTAQLLDDSANASYSPLSLYMAMALVSEGAEGETLEQFSNLLLVDNAARENDPAILSAHMHTIMQTLPFAFGFEEDKPVASQPGDESLVYVEEGGPTAPHILSIANSLWVDDDFVLMDTFEKMAMENYQAEAQAVNFADEATGDTIGQWVGEHTGGLLQPEYQFTEDTALALVNTVYLADSWVNEFYAEENTEDAFHLAGGGTVDCTYMNKYLSNSSYLKGEGFTGIHLAFNGSNEAWGGMSFILPDEDTTAGDLLADPAALVEMLAPQQSGPAHITLQLPKFSFGNTLHPTDALKALGLADAFSPDAAQLTGLANSIGGQQASLFISAIQQDCHIGIDETGVEAAAATMIGMAGTGMPTEVEEIDLIFDRPFLFVIQYNELPLFIGVVANPTAG